MLIIDQTDYRYNRLHRGTIINYQNPILAILNIPVGNISHGREDGPPNYWVQRIGAESSDVGDCPRFDYISPTRGAIV